MKIGVIVLVLGSALVACGGGAAQSPGAASAATGAQALDGTSYEVSLNCSGQAPEKDTLNFVGGQFESTVCTAKGFPQWTAYTAQTSGDATSFHTVTHHPSGTTVEWNGTRNGDSISGTVVIAMNGETRPGTFQGVARR